MSHDSIMLQMKRRDQKIEESMKNQGLSKLPRFYKLSNGINIPSIGIGTFQIKSYEEISHCLQTSLENNISLVDTASGYKNEHLIGKFFSWNSNYPKISRKNIFLTTKVGPEHHGYEKTLHCVTNSLKNLYNKEKLSEEEYLDLVLIHWPGRTGKKIIDKENPTFRKQTYQALEDLVVQGKIKSIGVSNYSKKHLGELLCYCRIFPVINQVEIHPHFPQIELMEYCKAKHILIQAYSSLGTTVRNGENPLLGDNIVRKIAEKRSLSSAEVLLKWALHKGFAIIPKSTNSKHIAVNAKVMETYLEEEDMILLDSIQVQKKYCWNPEVIL
eukprot:snap_masked-scaffold_23-processed-gene-3.13-mRNA-1 protein AED:0.05 eAED:0.09 QI:0/-1/0/1/-1/1/1/0/327